MQDDPKTPKRPVPSQRQTIAIAAMLVALTLLVTFNPAFPRIAVAVVGAVCGISISTAHIGTVLARLKEATGRAEATAAALDRQVRRLTEMADIVERDGELVLVPRKDDPKVRPARLH